MAALVEKLVSGTAWNKMCIAPDFVGYVFRNYTISSELVRSVLMPWWYGGMAVCMVVGYVSPKIAPETAGCGVERFQETWMSCEVKPQTAKLAAAIDFFLSNSRCSGSQMPEQRLRSSYSGKASRLYVVLFPDLDSSTNPDSSTDSVAWSNPISAFPEQRTRLFEDLAILAKDPAGCERAV